MTTPSNPDPRHISRSDKIEACLALASGARSAEDIAQGLDVSTARLQRWLVEFGENDNDQFKPVTDDRGQSAITRALGRIAAQNEAGGVVAIEAMLLRLIAVANIDEERMIRALRRVSRNPQLLFALTVIDSWEDGAAPSAEHSRALRMLAQDAETLGGTLKGSGQGPAQAAPQSAERQAAAMKRALVNMATEGSLDKTQLIGLLKRLPDASGLRPVLSLLDAWPAEGTDDPARLSIAKLAAQDTIDKNAVLGVLRKMEEAPSRRALVKMLEGDAEDLLPSDLHKGLFALLSQEEITPEEVVTKVGKTAKGLRPALDVVQGWPEGGTEDKALLAAAKLVASGGVDQAGVLALLQKVGGPEGSSPVRKALIGLLSEDQVTVEQLTALIKKLPDGAALRPALDVVHGWPEGGTEDKALLAAAKLVASGGVDQAGVLALLQKVGGPEGSSPVRKALIGLLSEDQVTVEQLTALIKKLPDGAALRPALDVVQSWPEGGTEDKARLTAAKLAASGAVDQAGALGLLRNLSNPAGSTPLHKALFALLFEEDITAEQLLALVKKAPDSKGLRPALDVVAGWPKEGSSDTGRLAAAKLIAGGDVDRDAALALAQKLGGQKAQKPVFEMLRGLGDAPLPSGLHKSLAGLLSDQTITKDKLVGLLKQLPEGKSLRPVTNLLDAWPQETLDEGRAMAMRAMPKGPLTEDDAVGILRKVTANKNLQSTLNAFEEGAFEDDSFAMMWQIFRRGAYMEDGCGTIADAKEWLEDAAFNKAYKAATEISAWGHDIRWRVYTLLKSAQTAAGLEGDFVECGVDRGGTALAAITYLGAKAFKDRNFYLFDTFKGLERSQLTEEEQTTSRVTDARYPDVLGDVRATFKPHDFTRIVPGPVPDTLDQFTGDKVAYLHIDMNVALPERAALEYFWPKLSPGAPVIFDDYGFPFHAPQRHALDEAAAKLGTRIMMLPTCQGLMWKT